jgi:hypothetical protein
VAHELGHLLGYGEGIGNDVTGEYLAPGTRHVPVAALTPLGLMASDPPSVSPVTPGLPMGMAPVPQSTARRSVVSPSPHGAGRGRILPVSGGPRVTVLSAKLVDSVLSELGSPRSLFE